MKVVIAAGITALVLSFFIMSTREDNDLGASVLASIVVGLVCAGLVALWMWAL